MRCSVFTLAVALSAAACQLPPEIPTEADTAELAAPAEASPSAAAAPEQSSLCAAYQRQLAASRSSLARDAENASLRDEVATFQAVIADACP